jgi:hypothetical protein
VQPPRDRRPPIGLLGSVFRSERFVIGLEVDSLYWKIFQVVFSSGDGSIFVTFPYFQHTTGIVSLATVPANSPAATLHLQEGGKVSSHLVKYSHHPDGQVLFSQDRRVFSKIRKQGVPLAEVNGHLFTVHAQGFRSFGKRSPKDEGDRTPNPKRTVLTFRFEGQSPESVKFVARLHSRRALAQMVPKGVVHPNILVRSPEGTITPTFVCSSLKGTPGEDRILLLLCEPLPRLDQGRDEFLLFLGGFDAPAVSFDHSKPTSMLAFSYPVPNGDELRQRIGSIDFPCEP